MAINDLVVTGDLILLNENERIAFYLNVCNAMGLNPYIRPLQYFRQIDRFGKETVILYALRNASAQLASKHKLSSGVTNENPKFENDIAVFKATVRGDDNREESAVGVVSLKSLSGKEYADGIMAAQTKAKRRAILDYAGYGILDESEIEGMKGGIIEVTEEALRNFAPLPVAPSPNNAPAVEIVAAPVQPPVVIPPVAILEMPLTVPGATVVAPMPVPEVDLKAVMDKIVVRLNVYKRDVLQRGGMRPSKGFGIAAKWEKFLRKHASNKTVEEYTKLLVALDDMLGQADGEMKVAAWVERDSA
jgi:hypothetical protein